MAQHYRTVLETIAANPQLEIRNVDLLGVNERKQILEEWNRTHRDYPHIARLAELVEKHAEHSPEAIAITCQGKELNYRELNDRTNQSACYLIR
jgi:non-ribosomal peptide synthetase component F